MTDDRAPAERQTTVREALRQELAAAQQPLTAKELSSLVRISEKDVAAHLDHLARSLEGRGERLETVPASCIACGFVFRSREKRTRPGACPKCRGTRIDPPAFRIVPA